MTRFCAVVLVAANLSAASFCLTAIPQAPKASALSLATGRDFFTWELAITHALGPVTRGEIVERLPFSTLLQWQAEDVLTRRIVLDKRTALAMYFGAVKDIAPQALVYGGARATDPYLKLSLVAAGLVWSLAANRIASKAPNPQPTIAHVLPDAGVPGDWDGIVVTGIVHDAKKIGPICAPPASVALEASPIPSELVAVRPVMWDRTVLEYARKRGDVN